MGHREFSDRSSSESRFDRRTFFRYGAYAGAAATAAQSLPSLTRTASAAGARARDLDDDFEWNEATIAELQSAMSRGDVTSRELTQAYIDRISKIDSSGPQINSVMELNSDALRIADKRDRERRGGDVRGPLHGIPVLVKDNIATADRMQTTAGSYALLGSVVPRDAFVAKQLRRAGAVLLGKTNLSEWANFRGFQSTSGWSGRAGVCLNPYALNRTACGSSTGSAAAVAANLAASTLGTETDGSIVCPAGSTSCVGIKPTLGLTSRSGVIPIAHSQDVVGPISRTVEDAAITLGGIVGIDPRDPATRASRGKLHHDYRRYLDKGALKGARLGVWRQDLFGFSSETDAVAESAFDALRDLGAVVIDPTDITNIFDIFDPEFTVLLYEFKPDLNAYLAQLVRTPVHTLAQIIHFNTTHAHAELQWFGQELMQISQNIGPLTDPAYLRALRTSKRLARRAIKQTMADHNLDAIVTFTNEAPWTIDLVTGDHFVVAGGASTPPAVAGYPHITVPAGYALGDELPIGLSFIGRAWEEPKLIGLAYAFEQGTRARHAPRFRRQVDVRDYVPRAQIPRRSTTVASRPAGAPNAAMPAAPRRIGL